MDIVLKQLDPAVVSCYLDDILIHTSGSIESHLKSVEDVLETLSKSNLHLRKHKCSFAVSTVEWLGHTISKEGHRPIETQLQNVLNWAIPKTVHDLRRFLGAVNYYSKYIRNYAKYVQPLFRHVASHKKGSKKKLDAWTEEDSEIFNNLKSTLVKLPTLCPILDLPQDATLHLYTDSSDKAIGAVLEHEGRPVGFFSTTLSVHECRWPIRQKELFAVIQALKHWRHLCVGRPIIVHTDHKSLERVLAQNKIQEARINRWSFFLSEFDLTFKYIPGEDNVVADALSRTYVAKEILEEKSFDFPWEEYLQDPYWKKVIDDLAKFPQYSRHNALLYYKERICVPPSRHEEVFKLAHDGLSSGHQGVSKTQARVAKHFYWPGMYADVKRYVNTCHICAMAKNTRKLKVPTQALPVAPYPWHTVTMDLITGLPTTAEGFDAIYVFVDKFSKMVHLVPTASTIDAKGCLDVFIKHIYRLHGLPVELISDRDPRFTSDLFREAVRMLRVHMKMSTAHHAQTDGQTERANQVVEAMLRSYVVSNESLWVEYLPTIEFAINSSPAASTKLPPFEVVYGRVPKQIGFPQRLENYKTISPLQLMERIAIFQRNASENLQENYAKASPGPLDPVFEGGDEVYVSTELFKSELTKARKNKLTSPYDGPFRIKEVLGPAHHRVDFSPRKVKMHDVINVKFLKRTPGTRSNTRPGPITKQGEDIYVMERISAHKKINGIEHFLVKWEGYPEWESTWEPPKNFTSPEARQILADYRIELTKASQAAQKGKGKRKTKANA